MRIYLTNLGKYTEGELVGQWLELPYSEKELNATLCAIGIGKNYEEYFITDYESDLGIDIGEYDSIGELNEIAEHINKLDAYGLETLKAVIELESPSISNIQDIFERLDEYTLLVDIHEDSDLGYYYIHEIGGYDLERMGILANYLDYEAFGCDIRLESSGGFTALGWLEHE